MARKNYRGKGRAKKEKKVFPQVVGKVQMTREGYIFVIVEGEEDDVFVYLLCPYKRGDIVSVLRGLGAVGYHSVQEIGEVGAFLGFLTPIIMLLTSLMVGLPNTLILFFPEYSVYTLLD